jgi:hypothetical protein
MKLQNLGIDERIQIHLTELWCECTYRNYVTQENDQWWRDVQEEEELKKSSSIRFQIIHVLGVVF